MLSFCIKFVLSVLLFWPASVYSGTHGGSNGYVSPQKIWGDDQPRGRPQWLEHAVSVSDSREEAPMIAIVIDDLGVNKKMTKAALSLPAPITASFLSYADDLEQQTEYARKKGHELLLHTPMEPVDPDFYPGPNALKAGMSAEEIRELLELMLESFDGYVGINNHMGSKFTSDDKSVSVIMDELKKRGLMFLDSLTSPESVAWKQARSKHVPYAVRDVFLDNSRNQTDIMKQLSLLEKLAAGNHVAVAIGHPHKETIRALAKWIPLAKEKGFVFVPVSMIALIRQKDY